jgi:hypothetical protein
MKSLLINGVEYANILSTNVPARIDGTYFIDYIPRNKFGNFIIEGVTNWMDTIAVDTITINGSYNFTGRIL